MARIEATQLNIRSRFARDRAALLVRRTGMTTTQIVEEALRAYLPTMDEDTGPRLIRKGAILVKPRDGRIVSLEQADAALHEVRAERG